MNESCTRSGEGGKKSGRPTECDSAILSALLSRIKNLFPVLLPLIVKSFQQAMNRSIALQLRGYASPKRRAASLTNDYWKDKFCHRLLIASCLVLLGVKACLTIFN